MHKKADQLYIDHVVLSIVIVNSDDTVHTLGCLDSIFLHQPAVEFEVILVDNLSEDTCLSFVEEAYPEVRIFSAPERQGFARNYNLGMRQARGEYIMILNNDTIIHPATLTILLDALRDNNYGMVGPQLRTPDWQLQTVCARSLPSPRDYVLWQLFLDPALPFGKLYDWIKRQRLAQLSSGPVPCISGACMLVSRAVLDRVGLLDEGYEFYYEDIEWCHRMAQNGMQVAYIADAVLTHYGDQSLSKVKVRAKKSEYLSALRYFSQYSGLNFIQRWLLWLATLLGFCLRAGTYRIFEILTEKPAHSFSYWQLFGWILHQPPFRTRIPVMDKPGTLRLRVEEGE